MARRQGRPEKYPWDQWLDGKDKLLHPSQALIFDSAHFDARSNIQSVMMGIRRKAAERDVTVQVRVYGENSIALYFGDRARGGKYDWGKLLDGEPHILQRRRDYTCSTEAMRQQIYAKGREQDIRVRTQSWRGEDGEFLMVQANAPESGRLVDTLDPTLRPAASDSDEEWGDFDEEVEVDETLETASRPPHRPAESDDGLPTATRVDPQAYADMVASAPYGVAPTGVVAERPTRDDFADPPAFPVRVDPDYVLPRTAPVFGAPDDDPLEA